MTDPTPTPADLDVLAERWCRQRGIDSTWEHQSLAALLRSVREEGAKARWVVLRRTSPSGKTLFLCRCCERVSCTPDKTCPSEYGCAEWPTP